MSEPQQTPEHVSLQGSALHITAQSDYQCMVVLQHSSALRAYHQHGLERLMRLQCGPKPAADLVDQHKKAQPSLNLWHNKAVDAREEYVSVG